MFTYLYYGYMTYKLYQYSDTISYMYYIGKGCVNVYYYIFTESNDKECIELESEYNTEPEWDIVCEEECEKESDVKCG